MEKKTNVMRVLDRKKAEYTMHDYSDSNVISGIEVAHYLRQDPDSVFKTLVTVGKSGNHYVFLVPVNRELDLKKAAKCVQEKSIEMLKSKELLPLTGYVHGGCSPIGMKKTFKTILDESAQRQKKIFFSGGKIGKQVEISLKELEKVLEYSFGDLCVPVSKFMKRALEVS